MNGPPVRRRAAATLGLVGGSLGVAAGVIQATFGSRIPEWTGNKASPLALGQLTIVLSAIGLACAANLRARSPLSPGRQVAAGIGLLVPGALCFSTVGRLWYLPGALLIAAAVVLMTDGDPRAIREVVADNWLRVLVSVLGAFELLMAVSAAPVLTVAVGLIGGLALVTAPWVRWRRVAGALLLVGSLPFAALTWWSLVTPRLGLLALAIGMSTLRRAAVAPGSASTGRSSLAPDPSSRNSDQQLVGVPS